MTDEEIMNARPPKGANKRPGRKKIKPPNLTKKQAKFVQVYLDTDNATLAKKEAGYSDKTATSDIVKSQEVTLTIEQKRQELWEMFTKYSEEALLTQLMIMRNDKASFKTRLDATNSILDRGGLKPVERKEITGANGEAIQMESRVTSELAQRARQLLAEKDVVTIDTQIVGS